MSWKNLVVAGCRKEGPRTRKGSPGLDRSRDRGTIPPGSPLRVRSSRRNHPLQVDESPMPWSHQQNQHLRRRLQDDGQPQSVSITLITRIHYDLGENTTTKPAPV